MSERIYDKIGGKKMRETSEPKAMSVVGKILQISTSTKRKPAQLTIAIDDILAQQLMGDTYSWSIDPVVRGLMLTWAECHVEEITDGEG